MNKLEKNQEKLKLSQADATQRLEGQEGSHENSKLREFISEYVSEDVTGVPGQSFQKTSGKPAKKGLTAEQRRAQLLAARPSEREMRSQIRAKLSQEMNELKFQYRKLKGKAHAACKLNAVVAKMREIQEYFIQMAIATYEVLRKMWLRLVHGIY